MALGDLHVFTGEEYVDTELAPLLNESFNSLKEYVDDASRWQVMPVQFKGTNAKFLIHETTLGTGTTQVLPLVVLDNTDIAKFSACSLRVVMSTKNGSTAAVNCDISLQKVHNSNECNVNFNTTNSDDAKAEPCTFTYNNIKYAGLKLTTGNADTLWVSGYTTEEWIAPIVDTSVTNLVTLGSDMNVIPTLFKSLQTDKSPVNDYDVVNKKSLNDLTNIKTYSQLSQIGLSGGVLDNSPYAIGNALPANSMLIIGVSGSTNNHDYPVMTGNLTVVRAHSNHVMFQIDAELNNNDVQRYILQYKIDSVDSSAAKNWKRILTDVDTGYWQANEEVEAGDMRYLAGRDNTGYMLEYVGAGTTGQTQPVVPELTEVANYSAVDRVGKMRMIFNLADKDVDEILAAGVLYNRATYSELWNYVQLKPSLLISEAEWQAKYAQTNGKFVPYYSEGDGTTTFRTPLLSAYPCGVASSDDIGKYAGDGLPNVTGNLKTFTGGGAAFARNQEGIFVDDESSYGSYAVSGSSGYSTMYNVNFNLQKGNPIYGNADEVRPKTMYGIWVIKAVGVIVDSIGSTDIQNLLTGLNQLQTQLTALQNQVSDTNNFAIVYPDNGDETEGADRTEISSNGHYVINNPFPDYYVYLEPQVKLGDAWIKSIWNSNWGTGAACQGVTASQQGNEIHLVVGDDVMFEDTTEPITAGQYIPNNDGIRHDKLPCRVLVYKIGKIESGE